MSWSLNEVESLARKAARGTGLSWGLAEEAGKATRWLASFGLPGPEMLAALLTRNDGAAYHTLCPADTTEIWAAKSGALCPLVTGVVVCDHASELVQGREITLADTAFPLLLVPYVACAAELTNASFTITWGATTITAGAGNHVIMGDTADVQATACETVHIRLADAAPGAALPPSNRGDMSAETARTLNAFAQRTYAPDTPQSRLAGAGAGLTDND